MEKADEEPDQTLYIAVGISLAMPALAGDWKPTDF